MHAILCSKTHKRDMNMNNQIYSRNLPSAPLQPNLSVRPIPTKYVVLPIIDGYQEPAPDVQYIPTFNTSQVFYPGTQNGPWSGYAANIDFESCLRKRAHQIRNNPDNIYIPDSTSSVYSNSNTRSFSQQPQQQSQKNSVSGTSKYSFVDFTPVTKTSEISIVGNQLFHNSTRTQQMDL
jgi:hypothetical protein